MRPLGKASAAPEIAVISGLGIPQDWQTSMPTIAAVLSYAGSASPQVSDVHLHTGRRPWCRQGAVLAPVHDAQKVGSEEIEAAFAWISGCSRADWKSGNNATATVCDINGRRWQATSYEEIDGLSVNFRLFPEVVPPLEQLGLPNDVRMLAAQSSGLVVVAGVARSGRSTTLASLLELINRTRQAHILIIEHPVEFLHQSKLSLVSHRDIDADQRSTALAVILRSDPDVVLIGESRNVTDYWLCLSLAAAGHLVLTSMHALDGAGACERIADATGPSGQMLLSQLLQGVVTQRRLPDAMDPRGCHVAAEVLVMTSALRPLLRPGGDIGGLRTHLMNEKSGLDDVLSRKCANGEIAEVIGRSASVDPEAFDLRLRQTMML